MVPNAQTENMSNTIANYGFYPSSDRLLGQVKEQLDRVNDSMDKLKIEIREMLNGR